MKKTTALFLLIIVLFASACTSKPDAQLAARTVQAAGFENIQLATDYAMLDCGGGDSEDVPIAQFTATKNGASVSGVVCKNIISGTAYIRMR